MSIFNPLSWFGGKSKPITGNEPSEQQLMNALGYAIKNNGITPNELNNILAYSGDGYAPANIGFWDGDKYPGGYGATEVQLIDYWSLRQRSNQVFTTNVYASGIVHRLITNEINTGLTFESTPEASILNLSEEVLEEWAEDKENRFVLWSNDPLSCDARGTLTFGQIEEKAREESIIGGDILVVLTTNQKYKVPMVRLIPGESVVSPFGVTIADNGNKIIEGVEINSKGEQVAFYIAQEGSLDTKRIPATGPKSGKRLAWMVYGNRKRYNEVRGQPLLSVLLQSLREIDRYRDSAQRKAVINSVLAIFIKKEHNNVSSLPFSQGAAVRNDQLNVTDNNPDIKQPRKFNASSFIPGMIMEELNQGEEPHAFGNTGTDTNFPIFESAILRAMAWSIEIPPEILELSFNSNYSASQAAINEFKMYLDKERTKFGFNFCQPIFNEWLIMGTLQGRIAFPAGVDFIAIFRDPSRREEFNAWTSGSWSGQIKPSTDPLKTGKGYQIQVQEGWITNDRASKQISGTKFSKNIRRLKKENQQKADAARPLLEIQKEFGVEQTDKALEAIDELSIKLEELSENGNN